MNFRKPDLSWLVWRVFQRNFQVYRKTWKVSLSFNFFEPLFYLGALGFGLGAYVQQMEGLPYLNYLAPGLIASSAMFATAYECTYGSFVRMAYQKTYHAILATPASIEDVVMGDLIYGAFKSVLYGTVILLVVAALGLVASPWALLVPPVLAVSGLLFGALSMIWTGLVPNIDSFNYFFSLIITPLFLFSGVFFPLKGMPAFVQQAAWISPLYHVVNLTRDLVMGRAGVHLIGDLVWLLVATIVLLPAPVFLVRRLVIK
ncbi:MAG TPA: ABC transporter permease [Bacillota bacterium]|jgi:lipooligosaccharide transport system permease protein|nr:ABC transporter permease [Peptococcaceae bacterium MAG4]NLW38223.1 ABC transporter permease [Peptococcaceae bacterium]HPZ42359.1 ABC transporter permease [Bacillota bacterium]HQD75025.1 ABC transporter permease [Bacillota bacterium]HUM57582.1 ABC transporter permease [Bacillota bacterium]